MNLKLTQLIYTFLPGKCILCLAPTHRHLDLCHACEQDLPVIESPCFRCGLNCPAEQKFCGPCLTRQPVQLRCYTAFAYVSPINRLISNFKNGHSLVTGRVLSRVLAFKYLAFMDEQPRPHLLVPIPLHKKKLKSRGFNQAAEIADVLGDICNIPVNNALVRRRLETSEQKELNAKERTSNIRNAFSIDGDLRGYHIAIVDDVITTGATTNELAKLLLAEGASSIELIALARTPRL